MRKSLNKLPSAMAIQRSVVLSDGLFFNVLENGQQTPVLVVEHGLRGTQNVNTAKGFDKDVANPQRTESAKTDADAVKVSVRFDLRAAPLREGVTMCSEPGGGKPGKALGKDTREAIADFVARAVASKALEMLGLRYARNILNGRWLWRNRSYAQGVQVAVSEINGKTLTPVANANALKVPLVHFNDPSADEEAIAKILARGWSGEECAPALRIVATVDFGVRGAIEVFPSQNYVDKPKGFARSLYKLPLRDEAPELGSGFAVRGHAALRDQKIGNALRTIDTWYSDFGNQGVVTPIEPMGANLSVGDFLRDRKESAFELLKDIGITDPETSEGQFLLAILVRGGVFGEKSKKEGDADAAPGSEDGADDNEGA